MNEEREREGKGIGLTFLEDVLYAKAHHTLNMIKLLN